MTVHFLVMNSKRCNTCQISLIYQTSKIHQKFSFRGTIPKFSLFTKFDLVYSVTVFEKYQYFTFLLTRKVIRKQHVQLSKWQPENCDRWENCYHLRGLCSVLIRSPVAMTILIVLHLQIKLG